MLAASLIKQARFDLPALYAILNVGPDSLVLGRFRRLLEAGLKVIQIRAKGVGERELLSFIHAAISLRNDFSISNTHSLICINDFPELCRQSGADGLHVGQGDVSPKLARSIIGEKAFLGYSTHSDLQFQTAQDEPIDYVALGPIFESPTKNDHAQVVGLDKLRELAQSSALPLVAIGGINSDNIEQVFLAGADSVAMIAELENTSDLSALRGKCEKSKERYKLL